jgi:predicted RNA binding protein with dsRBD fold (UPF0201 family)
LSLPDFRAKLILEASVSPSEDPEKVGDAMKNVLGGYGQSPKLSGTSLRLVSDSEKSLVHIKDVLRDRHVRSAARKQLLLTSSGHTASLMLNRQAAASGVIAICGSAEESPLGPIYLAIESGKLEAAVDWLTAYEG